MSNNYDFLFNQDGLARIDAGYTATIDACHQATESAKALHESVETLIKLVQGSPVFWEKM